MWIKQLLNLLAVKFHTQSFFLLGDTDDFIRPCSDFTMRGTPINLQMGVICLGDGMLKTKYLNNDTCYLIEEKDQKNLI